MINKALYNKVLSVFHRVEILNEGQQPRLKRDPYSGWRIDRDLKDAYGETYRVNCPVCGDRKGHCYISALSFTTPVLDGEVMRPAPLLIHCFRRDCFKNNPEAIKAVADKIMTGDPISLDCVEDEAVFGSDSSASIRGTDYETLLKWQPDYHPITEDAPAEVLDYVAKRGIRNEDIEELRIGWGRCWNFKKNEFIDKGNWLLFPLQDQTGLRGFQSRRLTDGPMKYFFDARTPKKMCLYNRERASRYHIVAIAEGIIDALHIGRCGMAYFGIQPSAPQVQLIQQDGAKMVLYVPDQKKHYTPDGICDLDPPAIADKLITEWNRKELFPWGAYRVDVPKGDAGECTMSEIWEAILKQLSSNKNVPDYALEELIYQVDKM